MEKHKAVVYVGLMLVGLYNVATLENSLVVP